MDRRISVVLAVVGLLAPAGCGDGEDGASDEAARQDTAARASGLRDTSRKPVVPRPSGMPPRKLVVEDIVKGKGPAAKTGSTVVVHYVGVNFSNGQEFDASWDSGSPFPLRLGAGGVIEGWERGSWACGREAGAS